MRHSHGYDFTRHNTSLYGVFFTSRHTYQHLLNIDKHQFSMDMVLCLTQAQSLDFTKHIDEVDLR